MTNSSATPPGWYYAPGDAEGTQRYWDGAQWIGEPQAVAQQQPTPGFGAAPGAEPYAAPSYGAPGVGAAGYGAPSGYVPFAYGAPTGAAAMTPAPIGKRLLAWLIDLSPFLVLFALVAAAAAVFGDASAPFTVFAFFAALVYVVWNYWIRRGRKGQSLGDSTQGIKLVRNDSAEPAGFWVVFGRFFVVQLISTFTCNIGGIVDVLWPLWDDRNNRLGDKMFSLTVVEV